MNRETIEKAARDYVKPKASIIPLAESIAAKEGFITGAEWLADYLCKIPFDKLVYELHEYFKNKIEKEKNV